MTPAELMAEVTVVVETALATDRPIAAAWLTHEVVGRHPDIQGADVAWYQLCAHEAIRDTVTTVIRRWKLKPSTQADPQLVLPGFARLQRHYVVERTGDQVIVPVAQLTSQESEAKIAELRAMGAGCFQHADELERYVQRLGVA